MLLDQAQEWRRMLLGFAPEVRAIVRKAAQESHVELAEQFYASMLEDAQASLFLSHEQVQIRLKPSMARWIHSVLCLEPDDNLAAVAEQQVKIGEVHARVDVPVHLVLRGASRVKHALRQHFSAQAVITPEQGLQANLLVDKVMDLSMQIMSQAYASSLDRNARTKEAYRLFSVTHNVATLRERRRAELLEWQNQCLYARAIGSPYEAAPKLGSSDFGLWFRHKGMQVFQGLPESEAITEAITLIDDKLLLGFMQATAEQLPQRLDALRSQARHIALCMESLFEHNSQMDAGRDALTHLLNRKFLPVVLSKEVAFARESGVTFSILTIDIDHFKQINDTYGHEAGDMVLQQMAAILSNNSRGGDYLFRLGGEEFLMLLVDTGHAGAQRVAEKLRVQVQRSIFQLPKNQRCQVTISSGLVTFDGHPDYQLLLRRSDEALYAAKAAGRNRVVTAEAMEVVTV